MNVMSDATDMNDRGPVGPTAVAARPMDESRGVMMRDVKRMSVGERIALHDRLCREGTRIAMQARRVK